jgi:hypothetical protein
MIKLTLKETFTRAKKILHLVENEIFLIENNNGEVTVIINENLDTSLTSQLVVISQKELNGFDLAIIAQSFKKTSKNYFGNFQILTV